MDTSDDSPEAAGLPRRQLLLAVGGLVLLAGCEAAPVAQPVSARTPRAAASGAGTSGPAPSGPVSSGAGLPSPSPSLPSPPGTVPSSPVPSSPATSNPATSAPAGAPGGETPAVIQRTATSSTAAPRKPIFYVHDGPGGIALTIDDGPNKVYTPQILNLLAKYKITAAFCMIGVSVAADPGLAREVAAAGHTIVNHTWTHPNLPPLKAAKVADQIDRTTGAIQAATGVTPVMFRAPYGAWSPTVFQVCDQRGLASLSWSVDPRDWSRPGTAAIISNIMRNTRTGSIILEHDGGGDRSQTVAALKVVLPRLLAAGFTFFPP